MNSRMRRKADAERHNNRIILLSELAHMKEEVYRKHRVYVHAAYDHTNQSISDEIDRLKLILSSDNPPPQKKIAALGGRSMARMQMSAIAAMAGIGHIK